MTKTISLALSLVLAAGFQVASVAKEYKGKKILFVDSYHEGYDWSDGVTRGIQEGLKGSGVELKIIRLDTKRNKTEEFAQAAALKAKATIEEFKPDLVIASDDAAAKYLIAPNYKDAALPFVFCGLNWDASVYGFPCKNVTGMVEVCSVVELVDFLKKFAKGAKVGFLGEDTLTDRKEAGYYKKMLKTEVVDVYATTFADWKKSYIELQSKADILINYNFASIADWDSDQAAQFVLENTKIPSGAFQEAQMKHTFLGYLKVPEEQGLWSARAALKIFDGAAPSAIPVVQNKEGRLVLNMKLAEKTGIQVPYEIVQSAQRVIQ